MMRDCRGCCERITFKKRDGKFRPVNADGSDHVCRRASRARRQSLLAEAEELFRPLPVAATFVAPRYCQRPPWDDCDGCGLPDPVTRSLGAAP